MNVHFFGICICFPAPQDSDELDAYWRVAYARYITARAVEREDLLTRLALDLSCPSWPLSLVAVDYDDAVCGHYVDEHMTCLRALIRLLLGVDDILPASPFAADDDLAETRNTATVAATVWTQAPLAVASVFGAAAALDTLAQLLLGSGSSFIPFSVLYISSVVEQRHAIVVLTSCYCSVDCDCVQLVVLCRCLLFRLLLNFYVFKMFCLFRFTASMNHTWISLFIAGRLAGLQVLDLHGCAGLTEDALEQFVTGMPLVR
jgi:hypothetical protein